MVRGRSAAGMFDAVERAWARRVLLVRSGSAEPERNRPIRPARVTATASGVGVQTSQERAANGSADPRTGELRALFGKGITAEARSGLLAALDDGADWGDATAEVAAGIGDSYRATPPDLVSGRAPRRSRGGGRSVLVLAAVVLAAWVFVGLAGSRGRTVQELAGPAPAGTIVAASEPGASASAAPREIDPQLAEPEGASEQGVEAVTVPDSPANTPAPEAQQTDMTGSLMEPFVRKAAEQRRQRLDRGADPVLNEGRVNFVLFGYGETHEPPVTEHAWIGSFTVLSYDTAREEFRAVSMTHDIRAPEIERYLAERGSFNGNAIKMFNAYEVGGFDLMGEVIANATGLSPDFQVYLPDSALARFVDTVPGSITVQSPKAFAVHPYYLDGVKYDTVGQFVKGANVLDGKGVVQFIKTVPIEEKDRYDKSLEHNARKHRVIKGLLQSVRERVLDPGFWMRARGFFADNEQLANGSQEQQARALRYSFDPAEILTPHLGNIAGTVARSLAEGRTPTLRTPDFQGGLYIVAPEMGDGGVVWVEYSASVNPITRRDIERGVYPDIAMEVPYDADPYAADLVTGYWPSVRSKVQEFLTAPGKIRSRPKPPAE